MGPPNSVNSVLGAKMFCCLFDIFDFVDLGPPLEGDEVLPAERSDFLVVVERVRRRGAGVGVAGDDDVEEVVFVDPFVAGVSVFLEREAEREGVRD